MNKILPIILIILISLSAQALFEVKDASNNTVLEVSADGLRIFNEGDTLMVISSSEITAFIDSSTTKALSRSFSVTTSAASGKDVLSNAFEVTTGSAQFNSGLGRYTDFSPDNIFLGLNSGEGITSGTDNVVIGNSAGTLIAEGRLNVLIGTEAGNGMVGVDDFNYHGWFNTFIGHQAGQNSTNSSQNTYIGMVSGKENIDGDCNTFVGSFTGQLNNGNSNTIIGNSAGSSGIGTASNNTFLGYLAGNNATNGSENTFLGDRASYGITTGNYNTSVGYRAGYQNQVGDGNVMLGYEAGFDETGSNNLYIANTNTTTPLIKGTFPNTDLTFTTSRVSIIHPTGTANGLYFQNTYLGNTDTWHFYQYTTDELALFFNTTKKGDFDNVSGAYTSVSDKRLKKNIEDYKNILDKVMLLKPKEYNFISQSDKDKKYIGLIAQEVKELFPSFVHYSEEDDTYTMDYAGLSVIAIQAIKEQQVSIEENKKLKTRIEHLESEIEEINRLLR